MSSSADIREALEGIRKKYGRLTPSLTVKVAKHPDSILHTRFEWDDSKAAHEHRLWQARQLISTNVIRVPVTDKLVRAYIHVPAKDGEGDYLPVQAIVHQPDKLQLARDAALRALGAAEENVAELDEAVRAFGPSERASEQRSRTGRARALIGDARLELVGV